jgi:hypothetical protein
MTHRGSIFTRGPLFITKLLVKCLEPQKNLGTLLHKPSTSPKFSKPCHSIPFLGTIYPPNNRRATCALVVLFMCRVACPLEHHSTLHGFFSWGTHSPGLPARSRRLHVPPLHHGLAHGATPVTSLPGLGRHRPRGDNLLLPRRDCSPHPAPATGPAWPQHVPTGIGVHHRPALLRDRHGKGPARP